ncbi:hypothetical protein [Aneurinibacillus tyrosinisolvens]|uniref:hypothetical protein n=1 Tax=Aneurinibacillus tyrosinisolvens TaxID=1443435 RepID=UPI00063FB039|nr:hypothetical protein [Aneurinibacillus tyrosinisolvens]
MTNHISYSLLQLGQLSSNDNLDKQKSNTSSKSTKSNAGTVNSSDQSNFQAKLAEVQLGNSSTEDVYKIGVRLRELAVQYTNPSTNKIHKKKIEDEANPML